MTPETSEGFEFVEFTDEVGRPLLPFQRFAAVHGLELLPDGRPRFRIVLLIVSRQNGKTELPVLLAAWWQFRKKVPLTLGTSTQLRYAKESWRKTVNLVKRTRALDDLHEPGRKWYRLTNGETESWTIDECRHLIAAANDEGGRSLTIHRGIADELRQHHDYSAWEAFEPACSPEDAQIWALSNAGSVKSAVLNDLQDSAQEFIETGVGDERLGLLEWSAPKDADPEDVDVLLQANPRVGYGLDLDVLLAAAKQAKRLGGQALTSFKTERMCIRVKLLDPAIDPDRWKDCLDVGNLAAVRDRVALCWDLSLDGSHATLVAAAVLEDGRVRVEVVKAWEGRGAARQFAADMGALARKIRPRAFGWLPNGPAAAVTADMAERKRSGTAAWPPAGVVVMEIRREVTAVCMGLADLVESGEVAHSGDPLLNAQVAGTEKLRLGDAWRFTRRGAGHCDATYATAGAVHLARTLPPPPAKPMIVVSSR